MALTPSNSTECLPMVMACRLTCLQQQARQRYEYRRSHHTCVGESFPFEVSGSYRLGVSSHQNVEFDSAESTLNRIFSVLMISSNRGTLSVHVASSNWI